MRLRIKIETGNGAWELAEAETGEPVLRRLVGELKGQEVDPPPRWREEVVKAAEAWFNEDIKDAPPYDGVKRILRAAGVSHAQVEDYRNGRINWCGMFVMACYREAGFQPNLSLASVGRVLFPYASYQFDAIEGTPQWAVTGAGEVVPIDVFHSRHKARRWALVGSDIIDRAEPGDILLHQSQSGGGWHGHVMLVQTNEDGVIQVLEGNHSRTHGPDGKRRDGVGWRQFTREDCGSNKYINYLVKPSEIDFAPAVRYFPTRGEAQRFAEGRA